PFGQCGARDRFWPIASHAHCPVWGCYRHDGATYDLLAHLVKEVFRGEPRIEAGDCLRSEMGCTTLRARRDSAYAAHMGALLQISRGLVVLLNRSRAWAAPHLTRVLFQGV